MAAVELGIKKSSKNRSMWLHHVRTVPKLLRIIRIILSYRSRVWKQTTTPVVSTGGPSLANSGLERELMRLTTLLEPRQAYANDGKLVEKAGD